MKDKYTELTNKQKEVCGWFLLLVGGKDWKEKTAAAMVVTLNTVKTHLTEVFRKLEVETQAELMHKLLTEGF